MVYLALGAKLRLVRAMSQALTIIRKTGIRPITGIPRSLPLSPRNRPSAFVDDEMSIAVGTRNCLRTRGGRLKVMTSRGVTVEAGQEKQ